MSVKNLYDKAASKEILGRLDKITQNNKRQWGTMTVAQMMKHMITAYDVALGKQHLPKSQPLDTLVGNPLGRWLMIDVLPFLKGLPTAPEFIVKEQVDFEVGKANLLSSINEFLAIDPSIEGEHPIFGKMDKETWGKLMYKHTDHHFRQFGG